MQLELRIPTWGGHREGAGRKPASDRRSVRHRARQQHDPRCPVHVTLRAAARIPSMRGGDLAAAIRRALARASRDGFRLLQYSVQADHLHMLVEADEPTKLARGVQGLAIRVAKTVNRVLGRGGRVWGDRYHARTLATPCEVRNALVYVLNNWRKHVPGAQGLDPQSSAAWFDGWRRVRPRRDRSPVHTARTWLANVGWRRLGLLGIGEAPRRRHGRR